MYIHSVFCLSLFSTRSTCGLLVDNTHKVFIAFWPLGSDPYGWSGVRTPKINTKRKVNMQIIKYVPSRDSAGKFVKNGYRIAKIVTQLVIVLMAIWGVYMTKQVYNFKCSEGGYFTTKAQCDTFANAKFYEQELGRLEFIQDNADIFGVKEAKAND